jgi:hypothetical protein
MPSTPAIMESERSRLVVGDSCLIESWLIEPVAAIDGLLAHGPR